MAYSNLLSSWGTVFCARAPPITNHFLYIEWICYMVIENNIRILTHHPRGLANDVLNYNHYAETICEILVHLTDENTGLTIGIFGDWGSGKSTVLGMVKDSLSPSEPSWRDRLGRWTRINRIAPGTILRRIKAYWRLRKLWRQRDFLMIEFDTWRYGKQEDVWLAFLRVILKQIEDNFDPIQIRQVAFHRWVSRLNFHQINEFLKRSVLPFLLFRIPVAAVLIILSSMIIEWGIDLVTNTNLIQQIDWETVQNALELSSSAAIIWLVFTNFIGGLGKLLSWLLSAKLKFPADLLHPPLDMEQIIVADQFRDDLAATINSAGAIRPIVVLVDDLDRAPVDQIVPLLEAIKHFGLKPTKPKNKKRPSIAFVLAADRRTIEHAIASHHEKFWSQLGDEEQTQYPREYLEKIVQIVFQLPPLSPAQLMKLLDEKVDAPSNSFVKARQAALWVFTQGPRQLPRETIEAYNTFQSWWLVVEKRDLQKIISPQLLAALILIHYVWPQIFEQISCFPEFFFDLHGLVSNSDNRKVNDVYLNTESEEVLSLGCPSENGNAMVEQTRRDYPGLLKLLSLIHLPENLTLNGFYQALTLTTNHLAPSGRYLIEVRGALLSGDSSLVKFANRAHGGQVAKENVPWLLEFLLDTTIKRGDQELDAASKQKMIRAIFALGRIGGKHAVEPLIIIIENREKHTDEIVTRTLFALAHLAEFENEKISQVIADLLEDKFASMVLHVRSLRLFGPVLYSHPRIRRAILCIALYGTTRLIREIALEHAQKGVERDHQGTWLIEALNILKKGC